VAFFDNIANLSIRDQIRSISTKIDDLSSAPAQNVGELTDAVRKLGDQVKALDRALNGEPVVVPPSATPLPQ
jgi:hypothetical protein